MVHACFAVSYEVISRKIVEDYSLSSFFFFSERICYPQHSFDKIKLNLIHVSQQINEHVDDTLDRRSQVDSEFRAKTGRERIQNNKKFV